MFASLGDGDLVGLSVWFWRLVFLLRVCDVELKRLRQGLGSDETGTSIMGDEGLVLCILRKLLHEIEYATLQALNVGLWGNVHIIICPFRLQSVKATMQLATHHE